MKNRIKAQFEKLKNTIKSRYLESKSTEPPQRKNPFHHSQDAFRKNKPSKSLRRPEVSDSELSEVLDDVLEKDPKAKT